MTSAEGLFAANAVIRGTGPFPVRELHAHYREIEGEMDAEQIERRRRRRRGPESEESPGSLRRGAELTVRAIIQGQDSEVATTTFWEDSPLWIPLRSQPVGLRVQLLTSSSYHVGLSLIRQVHLLKHTKYRDSAARNAPAVRSSRSRFRRRFIKRQEARDLCSPRAASATCR